MLRTGLTDLNLTTVRGSVTQTETKFLVVRMLATRTFHGITNFDHLSQLVQDP
jgi:hypothetical protein